MKRDTPNWTALREALWERSKGLCEVSGQPLDPAGFDAHHRRPKGMGGTYRPDTDTLVNLLALAPYVHNMDPRSVHLDPTWSRPRGYLVAKNTARVDLVPVLHHSGIWVLLTHKGPYIEMERAGAEWFAPRG